MVNINDINPETKTIEFTVNGKITRKDLNSVYAIIEEKEKEWGEINFLEKFIGMKSIEPLALVDDLKLYLKHKKYFKKAALVTDTKWISNITALMTPFIDVKVKVFSTSEIDIARQWLEHKAT